MDGRICTTCGEYKPWEEFSLAVRGRMGRMSVCKSCSAARSAALTTARTQVLTCRQCGTDFPNPARNGPDRKYCSPVCKGNFWHEQSKRERQAAPPRPCDKCGGPVAHRMGRAICKECRVDDRSRPYKRAIHIRSQYGLEQAEYDLLLERQRNRCAICKTKTPGGSGNWHVDHDHVTRQIRGLLCNNCNLGIGLLQDDPKILVAATQYVTKHRQMELFSGKAG